MCVCVRARENRCLLRMYLCETCRFWLLLLAAWTKYSNDFMIYFTRFFPHSTPNHFKHQIIFAQFFYFVGFLLPLFIIRFSAATGAAVCAVAAFKLSNIKMILFHDGNHTQIPTIEVADKHQQCRWYWLYMYVVKMVYRIGLHRIFSSLFFPYIDSETIENARAEKKIIEEIQPILYLSLCTR